MTRLQQILIGAYRDLAHWRDQTRVLPCDAAPNAHRHNRQCDRATHGAVACDVRKWLGKPQTASDRVSTSRVYKQLAARGLAKPIRVGDRGNKTAVLALTPQGESEARRLIAALPEAAPATSLSPTSTANVSTVPTSPITREELS